MKKVFLLSLLALTLFSCYNPKNEPFAMQYTHRKVIDLDVLSNEWRYSSQENNNYFVAQFKIDDINADVYNNGIVQVYREYDTGTNNATQILLPYVHHNEEYLGDDENGNQIWTFYTETVDCDYGYGLLNIYYTVSDFEYELNNSYMPTDMHFRVVLLW